MEFESIPAIAQFYAEIDIYFLIFVRLIGFFIIMPILTGTNIPIVVKIGLATIVALLIHLSGNVTKIVYSDYVIGYGILMSQEFFTGFIIGFVVYLILSLIYFAGQLIDYQIGFSMLTVFDPTSQLQVPILGNLFYSAVCVVMITSGGFNAMLSAFFYSFKLIPLGAANIMGNGNMVWNVLQLLINFFVISVKISMPLVGSILIIDIALGLLVKSVPQMNIFVVGAPLKLLGGLAILIMTVSTLQIIYQYTYDEAYNAIIDIIRRITP